MNVHVKNSKRSGLKQCRSGKLTPNGHVHTHTHTHACKCTHANTCTLACMCPKEVYDIGLSLGDHNYNSSNTVTHAYELLLYTRPLF